ncbi:MAG TPA: hypothetical protein DCZ94_20780 [Lentisphaeria bacterium]|nr:MAG: hypothetical protein A2X48_09070 [Lentisphaerae bacterium GWF2_49_21]HBC89383.1 hypothetical protein [Lentisphaeria bacterium]
MVHASAVAKKLWWTREARTYFNTEERKLKIFETLFKYPLDTFQHSHFVFSTRIPGEILFVLMLGFALLSWYLYRNTASKVSERRKQVLLAVRLSAIVLIFFILAVPTLRNERTRDSVITAVLLDTSRSMSLPDATLEGGTKGERFEAANKILFGKGAADKGLIAKLSEFSKVYNYAFDKDLRRVVALDKVKNDRQQTNIFRAIRDLDSELQGAPLASVLMLTDGCRNLGGSGEEAAALLRGRGVPLNIIGIGDPRPSKDYEVAAISAPRRVRRNTEIEIFATLRYTDFQDKPFKVSVSRGDTVLLSKEIKPDKDTDIKRVKLNFTPDFEGSATCKVSIAPDSAEKIINNNSREFLIEIRDDRLPVLYIEGSPRLEYRFLRRALYRDRDFRLVGILRLAKNRFYIQGADASENYLSDGFPTTRDQLFHFEAVILGDIEASYFSAEQMSMLEDFVKKRGGGLLMLGGVNSFGSGKYANTPVAKLLPLEITGADGNYSDEQYKAAVAKGSLTHPVMRLSDDMEISKKIWEKMPELIGISPVRGLKTGAQLLLGREKDNKPVLAVQNFGEGRVASFTSGGSWYWRVSVPASDEFHERFWKQLVRWLAVGAKQQISVESDADVYTNGSQVSLRAVVLKQDLSPANDATVIATVEDPLKNTQEIPMQWILSQEGVYQCSFRVDELGDYRVKVRIEGWKVEPVETDFKVSEPYQEFSNAGLKEESLREMAEVTGGKYYTAADAQGAAEEMAKNVKTALAAGIQPKDYEIWDMPVLFILLIALLSAEWIIRRRGGLA